MVRKTDKNPFTRVLRGIALIQRNADLTDDARYNIREFVIQLVIMRDSAGFTPEIILSVALRLIEDARAAELRTPSSDYWDTFELMIRSALAETVLRDAA